MVFNCKAHKCRRHSNRLRKLDLMMWTMQFSPCVVVSSKHFRCFRMAQWCISDFHKNKRTSTRMTFMFFSSESRPQLLLLLSIQCFNHLIVSFLQFFLSSEWAQYIMLRVFSERIKWRFDERLQFSFENRKEKLLSLVLTVWCHYFKIITKNAFRVLCLYYSSLRLLYY